MKLLEWMHNKFRQTNIDHFKDLPIGNPCICLSAQASVDEEDLNLGPSFSSRYESRVFKQQSQESENPYPQISVKTVQETLEGKTAAISEFFEGFLSIGTLGSETIDSEPLTPTFTLAYGNATNSQTEVTRDDVDLINYKLEKFLEAEAKEDYIDESSGRISLVSTITLSDKQIDQRADQDENNGRNLTCPLQGYLFGSSIELPEMIIESKREKTTLEELFHGTKTTNDNIVGKSVEGDHIQVKHVDKSTIHSMKKMIKKLYPFSRSSTPNEEGGSCQTKKKLQKVLRVFYRKVPPKIPLKENIKSRKNEFKNALFDAGYNPGEAKRRYPQEYSMPEGGIYACDPSGNKGHWIKTDADYYVLEL